MVDPFSLSAIGAVAIAEGIKFLYGQAGEILKRWRDRREDAKNASAKLSKTEPIEVKLPAFFEGQLSQPQIHFDAVERLEEQLRGLRKDLSDYAENIATVDVADKDLLQKVDAFRRVLEAVYQQRLTFRGERRPPSGPVVGGSINVGEVAGYVAGVRAHRIVSGNINPEVEAERVTQGGEVIGVDVDTIGE